MIATLSHAAARGWAALRARRTALTVAGAVGFGALAVVGGRNYIAERLELEKARLQPRHEMVEVVVAKRDLRRGEVVGPDTMAVRALPREYAPGAAVVPARFDAIAGGRLQVPMRAGEPLLAGAVASAEAGPISARVKPGVRAMTIAVDEVNSLSGMLQPGDRIDLLLSVRPPAAGGVAQPEITRTVMQGVAVMATGRQSRASLGEEAGAGRPYTSITVEVDPDQAQRLVVAQRSGKLTAVLRNPEDRTPVGERRLDVNALLGLPPPVVAAASAPTVEVIVGGRGTAPSQSAVSIGASPGAPPVTSSGTPSGTPSGTSSGTSSGMPSASDPPARRPDVAPPAAPPEGVWVPLGPPAVVPLFR
jgi:pilus assembly protein CpaB